MRYKGGVSCTCPICGKPAALRPANRSFPFCSDRCRLVDLGKWLGEEYRIPGGRAGDGAPGGPTGDEDGEHAS
jgi:endogenous inhibitor of DNA gyrase (YacG/DUF329 family)